MTSPVLKNFAPVAEPWVVEDEDSNLIEVDPATGKWWSRDAALSYIEDAEAMGLPLWAYPRTAIGLVV